MTQSLADSRQRNERPLPLRGKGPLRAWILLVTVVLLVTGCTTAGSEEPPDARPAPPEPTWLVTLGDSYISGEGARWAGNTSGEPGPVDALGADAYGGGGDVRRGCHRAAYTTAVPGTARLRGKNFACSGATTRSHGTGSDFKPGLDWDDDGQGRVGQLSSLEAFARRRPVSAVVVSIGGNDFQFGPLVGACVSAFLASIGQNDPTYCKDDPAVQAVLSDDNVRRQTRRITNALKRVSATMVRAGYKAADYRLVVQTYPSPLPPGPGFRYRETLLQRFLLGGCGLYDADATWANSTLLATINGSVRRAVRRSHLDATVIDMTEAFVGHRLCERGSAQLEETELTSWQDAGAVDALEWVNMIYTKSGPWELQESLHPNYWGSRAMRRCVRASLAGGPLDVESARSGYCRDGRYSLR